MWCPLPWNHLSVKNNGDLRLCSHSQALLKHDGKSLTVHSKDIHNCDTLKQVRSDFMKGTWPEQCTRCEIESKTGNSRNTREIEFHKHKFTHQDALNNTLADGSLVEPSFQFFDLLMGNQCNLR